MNDRFPDNLNRLLGMHDLTDREAAPILGLSHSTLGKWRAHLRTPSFTMALKVGEFFGVPADRLATAEFTDLLQHELADPERFEAVERRIHRLREGLRAVDLKDRRDITEIDPSKGERVTRRRRR